MSANLLPLEHLNETDIDFLAAAVSPRPDARDRIARLLRDGGAVIERALDDERTHRALQAGGSPVQRLSPYLLFAVLLHRRRRASGGGDPGEGLLASPWTRHYLAELLATFSRMPPGMVSLSLGGRSFRTPLHEVDLAALNKIALLASEAERLAIYRRLGDLTLFLSSVTAGSSEPVGSDRERVAPPYSEEELEREGRRYYEYAAQHRGAATSYLGRTLPELATRYGEARQLLRQVLGDDLPRVYPGGLAALARRHADSQQFGDMALSTPDGGRE